MVSIGCLRRISIFALLVSPPPPPPTRLAYSEPFSSSLFRCLSTAAFYWRIRKDFSAGQAPVPEPIVLLFKDSVKLDKVRDAVLALGDDAPRVVIHFKRNTKEIMQHHIDPEYLRKEAKYQKYPFLFQQDFGLSAHMPDTDGTGGYSETSRETEDVEIRKRAAEWAEDSVGTWPSSYDEEYRRYALIPSLRVNYSAPNPKYEGSGYIFRVIRSCVDIFSQTNGNRSCFDKCD